MDANKLKRYELLVYLFLLAIAVIVAFVGNMLPQGTINSIMINVSSELIAASLLFFLVNRFLLADDQPQSLENIEQSLEVMRADAERLERRRHQKVRVMLQNGWKKIELPVALSLADLSRAEVLGRIGMIPTQNPKQRFELAYFNTEGFLLQIAQLLEMDDSNVEQILTIPCSEQEITQFVIANN
jgi:hypothetical protein